MALLVYSVKIRANVKSVFIIYNHVLLGFISVGKQNMVAVVEERTSKGFREIALMGFSCCGLFLLIALLTFDSNDPGWSHSTSYQSIQNACGLLGAWLANFVLYFFGLMAYLIPLMIAVSNSKSTTCSKFKPRSAIFLAFLIGSNSIFMG